MKKIVVLFLFFPLFCFSFSKDDIFKLEAQYFVDSSCKEKDFICSIQNYNNNILKWTPKSGQKYNLNILIFELIINLVRRPVIIC